MPKGPPLNVVHHVDLHRYLGKWYEIASYPQRLQKNCVATTAAYSLSSDGDIDVLNECHERKFDGPLRSSYGKAWVTDPQTNAKLKVRFFWPFSEDYWIIDLDESYSYAVVGKPSRDYLCILSRNPNMSHTNFQSVINKLRLMQYDITKLRRTIQPYPN